MNGRHASAGRPPRRPAAGRTVRSGPSREGRAVRRTVFWTTLVFFLLLAGGLYARRAVPEARFRRLEEAVAAGDTDLARSIAGKLEGDELEALRKCFARRAEQSVILPVQLRYGREEKTEPAESDGAFSL